MVVDVPLTVFFLGDVEVGHLGINCCNLCHANILNSFSSSLLNSMSVNKSDEIITHVSYKYENSSNKMGD